MYLDYGCTNQFNVDYRRDRNYRRFNFTAASE